MFSQYSMFNGQIYFLKTKNIFVNLNMQRRLTWRTTDEELASVEIGDYVTDRYWTHGTVIKIERMDYHDGFVYYFYLEEGGKLIILR